jgi:hypothetical protein
MLCELKVVGGSLIASRRNRLQHGQLSMASDRAPQVFTTLTHSLAVLYTILQRELE